jgi:hypothetical protein
VRIEPGHDGGRRERQRSVSTPRATTSTGVDCFYVYGTVSQEPTINANLHVGKAEIATAVAEAAPFSPVCRVYAPIYRQVTVAGLLAHPDLNFGAAETVTAYDSIRSGFEDFLAQGSDGRPFVLTGHSQGAALGILLLERLVDDVPALRRRLVAAILLGGNVEVPPGQLVGGTFRHIPACSHTGEPGCVIAYSSFPSLPPADSLFGRPGQGVSLQSDQFAKAGREVLCVNPAALSGGAGTLDPAFPARGAQATPWVSYPGLYSARCAQGDGASWLEVTKATGAGDRRPLISEQLGPQYGYHVDDLDVAAGNLVGDVAAAERGWSTAHGSGG